MNIRAVRAVLIFSTVLAYALGCAFPALRISEATVQVRIPAGLLTMTAISLVWVAVAGVVCGAFWVALIVLAHLAKRLRIADAWFVAYRERFDREERENRNAE